jgi:apolipoprotein N-acyltransferase
MSQLRQILKYEWLVKACLALLSAGLLPFCFPPFRCWPLIFASVFLLLLAIEGRAPRHAFYLGLLQGTVGYGASLFWLTRIFGGPAIVLFALIGLFTAIFCLLLSFVSRQVASPLAKALLAASLWTAIEFYRSELFALRFPWITPGSALGPTFLSPLIGVYGTSFLLVAACATVMRRATLPLGGALVVLLIGAGVFRRGPVEIGQGKGIMVTVVQAEFEELKTYIALTRGAGGDSPNLIIWPEYALPYDVRKDAKDFDALKKLCAEMNAVLVVGTKTIEPAGKGWRNTALVVNSQGVLGEYYKARPVHFFDDGIPGTDFAPVPTSLGNLGTPICFDCDYSDVTRKMARLGAQCLIVPSCDPAEWGATQHLQHAELFRLRAAENGRWLACAASSGVSQIIDPHGNVHRSLAPMERGSATYRIGRSGAITFFSRAGWLFPWATIVASIAAVTEAMRRMVIRRRAIRA